MCYPFCGMCMFQLNFCYFKSKFWHQINLPVSRLPVLYSVILRLLASLLNLLSLFCCSSPRPFGGWVSVRSHQCSFQCTLQCHVLTHTCFFLSVETWTHLWHIILRSFKMMDTKILKYISTKLLFLIAGEQQSPNCSMVLSVWFNVWLCRCEW